MVSVRKHIYDIISFKQQKTIANRGKSCLIAGMIYRAIESWFRHHNNVSWIYAG